MKLDHSDLNFLLARGLYKAIQMMDSIFFMLEKGNQYLSAGVFFK